MRVCFVAGTLGRGGAERQLIFMLRALRQEGIETKLLCLTSGEALESEVRESGVDVEWVGPSPGRLARLWRIISSVRKYRPDIIQSSHFYTNIYVSLAGLVLGIPSIGAVRSNFSSELSADRIFGRWQANLPRHLITNSEAARERALKRGLTPNRIDLVRNIVDQENADRNRSTLTGGSLSILFVGRLGKEKRPELFVKLAERLTRQHPSRDLIFRLVGDGPRRAELEELRDSLGLPVTTLQFLGERSDMSEIYQNSDILVLTSQFEGTPNVVLEAMAHGIPVVATRVGGVQEILPPEAGILVDPADFSGLVSATQKLVLDLDLRNAMGASGKAAVRDGHSSEYLRRRLRDIYERILKRSAKND